MGILLSFSPFILFAVVDNLIGPVAGLIAGAAVSMALLLRDWLISKRTPKILEIGTVILFGGLALLAMLSGQAWGVLGVRLRVDGGLLLIVLVSITIRRPFTIQYAREQTPPEFWGNSLFIRTNYAITCVWAMAFLVMVIADLILIDVPGIPLWYGIIATILALTLAVVFTAWYPRRVRRQAGR